MFASVALGLRVVIVSSAIDQKLSPDRTVCVRGNFGPADSETSSLP
jgi:hypothetical protein